MCSLLSLRSLALNETIPSAISASLPTRQWRSVTWLLFCAELILRRAASALGYSALKAEQEQAITHFVNRNDVLVSLPTGCGKSLCFALLPRVFYILRDEHGKAIVTVISPLTSIIANQVTSFRTKGVTAAYAGDEKKAIKTGKYQLVFISPESLFCTLEWRRVLCTKVYRTNLVGVVVDEAHCIKKW